MKRIATLLCFLALLTGQKNFANSCAPCFDWCDLSYSVYADYLYWKVTRPDDTAVTLANPIAHNRFLDPGYFSGYRVGAAVYYNCVDFDARYSSLHATSSVVVTVPPQTAFDTERRLDYSLDYRVLDLAFGYTHCFQCHRGYVKPYVGAKLAWLKESTSRFTVGELPINFFSDINTNAYGPMLGVEGSWELFRCWVPVSFVARGDVSILSATSSYDRFIGIDFENKLSYLVVVQDIYFALGFDICNFSCVDANIQIGYEAQRWTDLRALNNGNTPGSLGLSGLVAHFNLMF